MVMVWSCYVWPQCNDAGYFIFLWAFILSLQHYHPFNLEALTLSLCGVNENEEYEYGFGFWFLILFFFLFFIYYCLHHKWRRDGLPYSLSQPHTIRQSCILFLPILLFNIRVKVQSMNVCNRNKQILVLTFCLFLLIYTMCFLYHSHYKFSWSNHYLLIVICKLMVFIIQAITWPFFRKCRISKRLNSCLNTTYNDQLIWQFNIT
jgi:magnesium-transporting ATPase (P-type)